MLSGMKESYKKGESESILPLSLAAGVVRCQPAVTLRITCCLKSFQLTMPPPSSALDQTAQYNSDYKLFIATPHKELDLVARALQCFSELPLTDFCRRLVIKADKHIPNLHSGLSSRRVVLYANDGQLIVIRRLALPRYPRHVQIGRAHV